MEVYSQDTATNSFCGFVISKNYHIEIFINHTKINLIWNLVAVYSFVIHNKPPVNEGNYARMQDRNIWIVNTEVNVTTSSSIVW